MPTELIQLVDGDARLAGLQFREVRATGDLTQLSLGEIPFTPDCSEHVCKRFLKRHVAPVFWLLPGH